VLPLFLLSVMVSEYVSESVGGVLMMIAWPIALAAVVLYWVVGFSYLFDAVAIARRATRERVIS
jgi:hypothetical protein